MLFHFDEVLRRYFHLQLSCFLVTAWDVFAEFEEKTIWDCPVEFTNVSVYQPVQVERTEKVVLGVLYDYKSQFSVSPLPSPTPSSHLDILFDGSK